LDTELARQKKKAAEAAAAEAAPADAESEAAAKVTPPPFPEYTSGHSTTSAAAAEMLTEIFGDGFAYTDSTELPYKLPIRSFSSFREAAKEASISRVYGGIHFRSGCDNGNEQGRKVAAILLDRLK
jgi:hypothetical protein